MRIGDVLRAHGIGTKGLKSGMVIPLNKIEGLNVDSIILSDTNFDGTNTLQLILPLSDGSVIMSSRNVLRKVDKWGNVIWQTGLPSWGFSINQHPITKNIFVTAYSKLFMFPLNGGAGIEIQNILSHTFHNFDDEGTLYVLSDGDYLYKYVPTNEEGTAYTYVWSARLGSSGIEYQPQVSSDGLDVFAMTDGSSILWKVEAETGHVTNYSGGWLGVDASIRRGIKYDKDRDVVFVMFSRGLVRVDAKTFTPINSLILNGYLYGVQFIDGEDAFYILDQENGLRKMNSQLEVLEILSSSVGCYYFNLFAFLEKNLTLHHCMDRGSHRVTALGLTIK